MRCLPDCVLVSLTIFVLAATTRRAAAQATTCDAQNQVCCSAWIAPVLLDGKQINTLSADDHATLSTKIRKFQDWNIRFCNFFGPQSGSCREEVQAPRCRPTISPSAGRSIPSSSSRRRGFRPRLGSWRSRSAPPAPPRWICSPLWAPRTRASSARSSPAWSSPSARAFRASRAGMR